MKKYIIAIDLGGTEIKCGLFNKEGDYIEKWSSPTDRSDNGANIISDIAKSVKAFLKDKGIGFDEIIGVGIGVPGPVIDDTIVNRCMSLGWGIVDVSKELSPLLENIPIAVGNDANTAALGEMWMGAAKGYKNVVLLTIGTDIGGGVIVDGKPVTGRFGASGEIGHMIINPSETEKHTCGRGGCFGFYASATGLARMATRELGRELTAKDVVDLVNENDVKATAVFDKYCDIFCQGLGILSTVLDPEAFILGGGVSKAGDTLTDRLKKSYRKYAFHTSLETDIICASLKNDAGIYGACYMALSKWGENA